MELLPEVELLPPVVFAACWELFDVELLDDEFFDDDLFDEGLCDEELFNDAPPLPSSSVVVSVCTAGSPSPAATSRSLPLGQRKYAPSAPINSNITPPAPIAASSGVAKPPEGGALALAAAAGLAAAAPLSVVTMTGAATATDCAAGTSSNGCAVLRPTPLGDPAVRRGGGACLAGAVRTGGAAESTPDPLAAVPTCGGAWGRRLLSCDCTCSFWSYFSFLCGSSKQTLAAEISLSNCCA